MTFNFILTGGIIAPVPDALSITRVDVVTYIGTTYRDTLTAAELGRPAAILVPAGTAADDFAEQSDVYMHVAPRYEKVTVTVFKAWSGTAGTGNILAEFREPLCKGYTTGVPFYL